MARRRTSYRKKLKIVYGAVALSGAVFMGYILYAMAGTHKVKFVEYKEFGIAVPQNYMIHGIDVSRYQEMISWEHVKQMNVQNIRMGFAFIKATEGCDNVDPFFKRNWKKAKESGIICGAYHYFVAKKDGKEQAKNFLATIHLENGDMPPVLDVEDTRGMPIAKFQKQVRKWLVEVEKVYHVKPIIYTYLDFYNDNLDGAFDDYPLWVAHYFQPERPRISRTWSFWQHSDGGHVDGILSKVDFNVFNGDSTAFQAFLLH